MSEPENQPVAPHSLNWTKIIIAVVTTIAAPIVIAGVSSFGDKIAWADDVKSQIEELKQQTQSISDNQAIQFKEFNKQTKELSDNTKLNALAINRMNEDFLARDAQNSMMELEVKYGAWEIMGATVRRVYLKFQSALKVATDKIATIDADITRIKDNAALRNITTPSK